jgi:hypothetical protein
MHSTAFHIQKGGVGKSTLSGNVTWNYPNQKRPFSSTPIPRETSPAGSSQNHHSTNWQTSLQAAAPQRTASSRYPIS